MSTRSVTSCPGDAVAGTGDAVAGTGESSNRAGSVAEVSSSDDCSIGPARLRVTVIEPDPSFCGGSERFALDLARALAARGHEISLIHDQPGTMLSSYREFAERCCRTDLTPFGWRTLPASIARAHRIARLCRATAKADVLFASNVHVVRLLALVAGMSRLPAVFHLGISSPLPYRSQAFAFRGIAAGVAPSAHTAQTWQHHGWPAKTLHVVPNWVDHQAFHPGTEAKSSIRRALGLPEAKFMFVCIGRLKEDKGTGVALEAFASIAANDAEAILVFVGSEDDGQTCRWERKADELEIPRNQIVFAGRRSSVIEYYRAADVAIVPSIILESFGLTVLESMACGVPPIISDVGIMPDILGPTDLPLVVPSGDPAALSTRMRELIASRDQLPSLGHKLRQRAVDHYSPERSVAQYERIMARAAGICGRDRAS